jgi:hypothetical protein
MNLVANWNPAYIQSLAARVQEYLNEEVYTEPDGYTDDEGHVDLYEQDEVESALSNILAGDDLLGIVESDDFADMAYEVFNAIPSKFFEDIKCEFEEKIKDDAEYARNPLAYVGMSQRDFL